MDIARLAALAVIATALAVVLRQWRPEMALLLSVAAGVLLLAALSDKLFGVITAMNQLAERAQLQSGHFGVLVRVVGVAYLGEFGAQICRDAGEGALATKVEMGGRILMLGMALPLLSGLFSLLTGLLPG